jgi:hypothetical protein
VFSGVGPSGSATRELISKTDLRELGCEDGKVDRTGSGSCPLAGFGFSGVEPSGSQTSECVCFST